MKKLMIYLTALVAPGVILFGSAQLIFAQAYWLFAWFTFIFTLATLLLTWVFSDWKAKPEDLDTRRNGLGSPFTEREMESRMSEAELRGPFDRR